VELGLSANAGLGGSGSGGVGYPWHDPLAVQSSFAAQLRTTLNAIPAYTWYKLASGTLAFVNERSGDYLGLPKDHPLRLGVDTDAAWDSHIFIIHPDDREIARETWAQCLRTEEAGEASFRICNANGEYHWFIVRTEPLRANDGSLLYWVGISFDIESQKQAEFHLTEGHAALRKSETEFRQILELTPLFVTVLGPRRERLYINRLGLDYLGTTLEQWREKFPRDEVHPDDVDMVMSLWKRALSDGLPFECEFRSRRNDGVYRWLLARCNSVRDDDGQVLRWYNAFTDIEDRKRAEEKLQRENAALREEINQALMFGQIVGASEPLQKVVAQAYRVAQTDTTVLILGETGTGKELMARAIHKRSKRAARAFIAVNCATMPSALIASELFGHEKGAFTGAMQRRLGRFEAANGGTIFLDEVGDLPADAQIALLRVLQEREIERVGSDKSIPVNVRVLAATHRDLSKLVRDGVFRQDLFYRLNVVPIRMPALRERSADIPLLVEYFLDGFARKIGKKFRQIDKRTMEVLQAYPWPGNVRELQNMIERAVTLSDSDIFLVDEAWLKHEPADVPNSGLALGTALLAHEKEAIETALAQSHGRISGPAGAAARLGIPATTLESKIRRLGIDKYQFKQRSP
jgi:formate hydrogenlyase transcriptional activator